MSMELDYFPPKGTKWKWYPKSLNYSPWGCDLSRQREKLDLHPLNTHLYVDRVDGTYLWQVIGFGFDHERFKEEGQAEDPLQACLAAEAAGESRLNEFLPDWVRQALNHKWRPPA